MVGIDIGTKSVKIVELEKSGNTFNLIASGVVGVTGKEPSKMADDKEFFDLAGIIKKLHHEAGISSRDVAISIPESLSFTRVIKFPMLTDAEIASAVKWESEQYIPIPATEAIIQHTILERKENSTPPEVLVLLVAAPRDIVEKYVKIVQLAGLNPVMVETELIALTRAIAPLDKTSLLVDIGATSTNIAIAKNGLLSFSRSIPIAGDAFTRALSQGLGVNAVQAEEYKKTYGLESTQLEGKVKGVLGPVVNMVTDEIKKAIHFYQAEEKGEAPSVVLLSGGAAGMPEIVTTLSGFLGIEVVVANSFSKVQIDSETMKKLANYSPLYGVALGLALRDD